MPDDLNLTLRRRYVNHQPIQLWRQLNLARQPRLRIDVRGTVEHFRLNGIWEADARSPSGVDLDMAGRTSACPSAIRVDTLQSLGHRTLHHGSPDFQFEGAAVAVRLNICNFDQFSNPVSARWGSLIDSGSE